MFYLLIKTSQQTGIRQFIKQAFDVLSLGMFAYPKVALVGTG